MNADAALMWAAYLTAQARDSVLPCVTGCDCDGSEDCRDLCDKGRES